MIKRIAVIAMMLALAIILSIIESFIPVFIPGFKLGLANMIILIMLYEFKSYEAFSVQILRILIQGLLRGTLFQPIFFMSLVGGILAFLVMWLFSRLKLFTPIGVSVIGAVFHSTGQIIVAIVIMSTAAIAYYLPFIALLSVGTGILSGVIAYTYLKRSITARFIEVRKFKGQNIIKDEDSTEAVE